LRNCNPRSEHFLTAICVLALRFFKTPRTLYGPTLCSAGEPAASDGLTSFGMLRCCE
jgi:hypothetical protein